MQPKFFFMGVAATWAPNCKGEQYMPGAFARSIGAFNRGSLEIPIMVEHGEAPEWPEPIGRSLVLDETSRGLEVTSLLTLSPEELEKLRAFIGPTWFLSASLAFHKYMYSSVKSPAGVQRLEVRDGLLQEISICRQPAAGEAARGYLLNRESRSHGIQLAVQ